MKTKNKIKKKAKEAVYFIKEHNKELTYLAIGIGSFLAGIFVGKTLRKK